MLKRGNDELFNIRTVSFMTLAVFLTIFSVAYADWYVTNITGYSTKYVEFVIDAESIVESDNLPPQEVVQYVFNNVEEAKEIASYAESIEKIISTKSEYDLFTYNISESDLFTYRINLEEAKKKATDVLEKSYIISQEYSSYNLSQSLQSMDFYLASIDEQIREINYILTEPIEERFEIQRDYVAWTVEHDERVQNSIVPLQNLIESTVSLGFDENVVSIENFSTTVEGEIASGEGEIITSEEHGEIYSERDLRVNNPGLVTVYPGQSSSIEVTVSNEGVSPLTNCIPSITGSNSDWLNWQGFQGNDGSNSLGPGESDTYLVTISTPLSAVAMNYFVNFAVQCNEGPQDGFNLNLQVLSNRHSGEIGELSQQEINSFLQNYPINLLGSQCQDFLNSCSSGIPNLCGQYSETYICAHYNECEEFEEMCVPNDISSSQMEYFLTNYVYPYFDLPSQCMADINAYLSNRLNSPEYISNCVVNQDCQDYNSACIFVPSTQGTSSVQNSTGGSTRRTTSSQPNATGITTTLTNVSGSARNVSNACQGDATCIALANTCSVPSYLIATNLDLVDFGPFGYNPVTRQICYMDNSRVYITDGLLRSNTLVNKFPNNVGLENQSKNNIISINFQSKPESSDRNYVATVVNNFKGPLTLNFLEAQDYNHLQDKIFDLISNLLYNESDSNYITGMTLAQADEIVNESAFVPWILWIILFLMISLFLFFGKFLYPYHTRLIYLGKKAINNNQYTKAIGYYNEIANSYATDTTVKQEALDYLMFLKERIGVNKIDLDISEKDALPKIKFVGASIFNQYSRVEEMISHALEDLNKSPNLAKFRMPIIAQEYEKLDESSREELASKYESLVYGLSRL